MTLRDELYAMRLGNPDHLTQFISLFEALLFGKDRPLFENKEAREAFNLLRKLAEDACYLANHDAKVMPIPDIMVRFRQLEWVAIEEEMYRPVFCNLPANPQENS